jgi:hypothetical protein
MTFFKTKNRKVTVMISKLIDGVEIIVFNKQPGSKFQINNQEIEEGDTLFFKDTTIAEGEEWLKKVGFVRENN